MSDAPKAEAVAPTNTAAREQFKRRLDGWQNLFTGIGTARDKRTAGEIGATDRIPFETLVDLYRSDPLAARIVERPAEEMLREWIELKIADEKDASEAIEQWLDRIGARAAFRQALAWRRAFGGAGIILGINKGNYLNPEELAQPLNPGDIETIDHLIPFASRELQAVAYYSDPMQPNFGEPAAYRIVPQVPFAVSGQRVISFGAATPVEVGAPTIPWANLPEVHESRILKFDGIIVTRRQRLENWGWGDSVLQRCYEVLRDFGQTNAAAAHLIQDFAQGVLTIPGFIDALAGDGGDTMRTRVEMMDTMRSLARMIVLDGGDSTGAGKEEFRRDVASLTSIPEILDRAAMLLAATADMPVSLLMGARVGAGGLSGGDSGDARNWYDHVADMQRHQVEPPLRYLISLGMQASKGPTRGKVFPLWSIYFKPLQQLDEVQQAAMRSSMAQVDEKMITLGVLQPDEVRKSRFGGDGYSIETQLDSETREAFEAVDPTDPTMRGETPQLEGDPKLDPAQLAAGTMAHAGEGDMDKPAPGATSTDLQNLALNGTQITGLLAILQAVRDGALPPQAGELALIAAFPFTFTPDKAHAIIAPIEVKEPPEPPDPIELAKAKAAGAPPMPNRPPPTGKPGFGEKA